MTTPADQARADARTAFTEARSLARTQPMDNGAQVFATIGLAHMIEALGHEMVNASERVARELRVLRG